MNSNPARLGVNRNRAHRRFEIAVLAWALGSVGLVGLGMAGCASTSLAPGVVFPLNPFPAGESNLPVIEKQNAASLPIPTSRKTNLLVQLMREHRDKPWQAAAVVDYIADEKGVPREIRWVNATDPEFGAVAAMTISHWRFDPGIQDGRLVRVHLQSPIGAQSNGQPAVSFPNDPPDHGWPTLRPDTNDNVVH